MIFQLFQTEAIAEYYKALQESKDILRQFNIPEYRTQFYRLGDVYITSLMNEMCKIMAIADIAPYRTTNTSTDTCQTTTRLEKFQQAYFFLESLKEISLTIYDEYTSMRPSDIL